MSTPAPTPPAATIRRERQAFADLCATREGGEALMRLSDRLRRIVPFEASFWCGIDPLTSMPVSPFLVENYGSGEHCHAYWDQEYVEPDVNRIADLGRIAPSVMSLHAATGGRPRRSGRHVRVHEPLGLGDELRVAVRAGGVMWGFLGLVRRADQPPFGPVEQKIVAGLVPALAGMFRRTALLRPAAPGEAGHGPGVLVFDGAGRLLSANDDAAAWTADLPAEVSPPLTRREAPNEFVCLVARARAVGAGLDDGPARLRVRGRSGRWLLLHASRLRGGSGDGVVTVVIEAAKASEIAPLVIEAYGLTARERDISQAVARGESTAQIAARLHLSPHTVRDHLKAVFGKTGVSSRGELVARLFADHYAPGPDAEGLIERRVPAA